MKNIRILEIFEYLDIKILIIIIIIIKKEYSINI